MELKKGATDVASVKRLQELLITKGYGNVADGNFGVVTEKTVKAFQTDMKLTPTGIVDDVLMSMIDVKPNFTIVDRFMKEGEYYKEVVEKNTIYLHHTAGSHRPDWVIDAWDNDATVDVKIGKKVSRVVATSFVIGGQSTFDNDTSFDGQVYRAFDDMYWCLTGDTKIPLLNGKTIEMSNMVVGNKYWVYSCDNSGKIVPGEATFLGITKYVNEIVELTFDNGDVVRCTPDHKIMLRDGSYVEAQHMIKNDSIMPLYRLTDDRGYEKIMHNDSLSYQYTHTMVNKHFSLYEYENLSKNNTSTNHPVTHHVDFNKLNNSPENLIWMMSLDHILYHNSLNTEKWKDEKYREKMINASIQKWENPEYKKKMIEIIKKRWENTEFKEMMSEKMIMRNIENWKNPEYRKKMIEMISLNSQKPRSEKWKKTMSKSTKKNWETMDHDEKIRRTNKMILTKYGDREERIKEITEIALSCSTIKEFTEKTKNIPLRSSDKKKIFKFKNHKITNVNFLKLNTAIPVYDLTVEKYHNFAINSGIFVHNCHHLGTVYANNRKLNQQSIGIEICNFGPLTKNANGQYFTYVKSRVPENQVIKLDKPFKGYQYYHNYTPLQLDVLKRLIVHLKQKYPKIEMRTPLLSVEGFELNDNAKKGIGGIYSHTNVLDIKFDVYPHPKLIQMLKELCV